MPVISAIQFRRWLSWLFLAGAVLAALASRMLMLETVKYYGADFPRTLVRDLPAVTDRLLSNLSLISIIMLSLVVAGLLGGALIARYSRTPESKSHSASLVALLMYHAVVMCWAAFVMAFFLLPMAKAGI